jgi:hypothetical protein
MPGVVKGMMKAAARVMTTVADRVWRQGGRMGFLISVM